MRSNQPPLTEADIPLLLPVLSAALSSDATVQKQAEALLASLETRDGFCSCLAAVVGNRDADHSARWLAVVQLKNNINKYWRPRYDSSGISAEEKVYLRGRFLQLIAVQVALLIAKAARFDFPSQWPSLFNDLLAGITGQSQPQGGAGSGSNGGSSCSQLSSRRTYLVLHHVLKELSSKRLAADQKAFAEVTKLLFDHVWGSWGALLTDTLGQLPTALQGAPGSAPPAALLQAFERWMLLLKILRRLLLFGFASDAKSFHHAGVLLPTLDLCYNHLLAAAGGAPYPAAREALLMACSQFILGVLRCEGYAGRASSGAGAAPSADQVSSIKQMSSEVQEQLSSWDLEEWLDQGEMWAHANSDTASSNDFGFEGAQFVPLLPAVMGALTKMLTDSDELDTQTQVFGLVNLIVDRLGTDISPHAGPLLQLLPQTWQEGAQQSLLRIQVLCCLSLLLNVLGTEGPITYPLLLPLLHEALHPGSSQPELLEDGLALWLVALRNAPGAPGSGTEGPAAPLLELTPALTACLALLGQLPLLLPHICSVWHELEASGSDDPYSERGDMLYGSSIWSSGHGRSWNGDQGFGYDEVLAGQSLVNSEEAAGEAQRRAAGLSLAGIAAVLWV
eukprot:gene3498-3767_t